MPFTRAKVTPARFVRARTAFDGLEHVNESDAYFGLIVLACDRAALNVVAEILIEHLAKNLPILVDIIPVSVIEPDRAKSSTQDGLFQSRCC